VKRREEKMKRSDQAVASNEMNENEILINEVIES